MAIKELFYDQRPEIAFNPRAARRIDPRFSYTRNSPASYVDQFGVLQPNGAPAGIPRFSYDPLTGEYLGLLVEEQSTNLFTYSQQADNPAWTLVRCQPFGSGSIADATTAPDGTLTADKVVEDTTANDLHLFQGNASVTAGVTYTASAFVKAAERRWVLFAVGGTAFGTNGVYVDLATGSTGRTVGSPIATSVTSYPNGWVRIAVTKTASSTTTGLMQIRLAVGDDGQTYNGDGVSGIYVWGMQFEGNNRLTSYIPTTAATATRAADLLSVQSPLPATGSVYIDARAVNTSEGSTLLSLKNASNQKINLAMEERSELYNSLALTYSIKGTVKPTLPYPVPTTNRERNIITWGAQNYQYNTDGARFAPSLSTTPGIPANLTQLSIGHDAVDPTKAFNGYINAVYLYNGEIAPTVAEALVRGELDPVNADTYSPEGPTGSLALIINTQGATGSGDKVFTLPAESALNDNDIVITWGDGTESGLDGAAAELGAPGLEHTYPSAGIYPVWVEGQLENLQFGNSASAPDLVKIEAWGTTADGNDVFLAPSTMESAFHGCSKLTSMPTSGLPDTSAATSWYRAFRDCSSLTGTFPSFNFSAATTFQEAFWGCSSITSFTAAGDQTQNVTNFANAWRECSSLTSFPSIDTSAGTNFSTAWYNCTGLTSFPLINTAAVTNFNRAWANCSSLTSFPLINTAAGTDFALAWSSCTSLTSFPSIDTSAGANFGRAWYNNDGLTAFPALNFDAATGLASDASNTYTGFREAWFGCGALADFPANRFNNNTCTRYLDAWTDCALTAQSIENILVSINTANTSNGNLGLDGGTNAAKTTWSTAANTAYDALVARGWTITFNA